MQILKRRFQFGMDSRLSKKLQNLDDIWFEYYNYVSFRKYVIHYYITARKIFITGGSILKKPTHKEIIISCELEKEINQARKQSKRLGRANRSCFRTIDGYHWNVKFKTTEGIVVEYKGYGGMERNLWHQLNWKLIKNIG